MENSLVDNKSCKIYFLVDNAKVYFNADFDSGNVQKVEQVSPYVFKVHPGLDRSKQTSNKTFFHFKVYGLKMCTANFIITRVSMLQKLIKSNQKDQSIPSYFPVYCKPNQPYKKVTLQVKKYYNSYDQPELSFSYQFDKDPYVQFAFSYPYSYQQCQDLISSFQNIYQTHHSIYFHSEVLCYTQQKRNIHIITITDKQNCSLDKQEQIQELFPATDDRPFKVNKPVIFMSARVHPGQSPSSYSIEGALRFLLNEKDCRSYLLRKNFLIKIIPMLNPDGVFHGMFRTDLNGENLNRVYAECSQNKHPTIWSIKKYAAWLQQNKNVLFFFDFHAHPSTKNFFIYGNSFSQICMQTEAQLFGKLIQFNCPYFQNFQSIYSQKQMKIKHKHDNFSKQGCARVFMHKLFDIVHSYTVQCGYFGWTKLNHIQEKQKDQSLNTGYLRQDREFEKIPQQNYRPQCYMLMGKSILITILDIFNLNPFPKKLKGQISSHSQLRKSCASKIYHQVQSFKMIDANSYRKINQISFFIEESYYKDKLKNTNLKLSTNGSNNILKEQLTYLNASPKTKETLKNAKGKKGSSSITKIKEFKRQNKKEFLSLGSKTESVQNKHKAMSQTPLPYYIQSTKQDKLINDTKTTQKYLGSKVKTLKFLYNDLQRFNQHQTDQSQPRFYPVSQKLVQNQSISYSKNNIFQNSEIQSKILPHLRVPLYKSYNTTLQPKQFVPQTRQNKIKSTLQKSITLRKGSSSKVVLIKKDDIKFLRIASLIQKKMQRQAINGSLKRIPHKQFQQLNEKDNLPSINGKKKI